MLREFKGPLWPALDSWFIKHLSWPPTSRLARSTPLSLLYLLSMFFPQLQPTAQQWSMTWSFTFRPFTPPSFPPLPPAFGGHWVHEGHKEEGVVVAGWMEDRWSPAWGRLQGQASHKSMWRVHPGLPAQVWALQPAPGLLALHPPAPTNHLTPLSPITTTTPPPPWCQGSVQGVSLEWVSGWASRLPGPSVSKSTGAFWYVGYDARDRAGWGFWNGEGMGGLAAQVQELTHLWGTWRLWIVRFHWQWLFKSWISKSYISSSLGVIAQLLLPPSEADIDVYNGKLICVNHCQYYYFILASWRRRFTFILIFFCD